MFKFINSVLKRLAVNKKNKIDEFNQLIHQCSSQNSIFNGMRDGDEYINNRAKEGWKQQSSHILSELNKRKYRKLRMGLEAASQYKALNTNGSLIDNMIIEHNNNFLVSEKEKYKNLFVIDESETIENKHIEKITHLDEQQQDCIIKNEVNNLVIAGAGSGKSTTILGKVNYLINRYKYSPDELLVLSFTNASAAEMSKRIKNVTNAKIDVMTFHKLGLSIIASIEGKPSLTNVEIEEFVNEKFNQLTKEDGFNNLVNRYFLDYLKPYKSQFEFETKGDYIDYMKDFNVRTYKRERVKSYEEMEIANFLCTNNVKYKYEEKYKIDTRTPEYRQYAPDFYLQDYDIYMEHFGIDRKGNVPIFFTSRGDKTPKEVYNEGIEWKRKTHKQNNTILIETYSYEKHEGVLKTNLKSKLEAAGVKLVPMTNEEIQDIIEKENANEITCFVKLISTFITLMKSNNYSFQDLKGLIDGIKNGYERQRDSTFIEIVEPIFNSYQAMLEENDDIDFNDMINKATEYVLQGKYGSKYKYIIVDEYQDISRTRYNLIKSIKDMNDAYLFCVGDDWQSIYRFAGSQVSLFTKFEELFRYTEKSYIETTYRFNQSLINLSSTFILKNKSQFRKQLKPYKEDNNNSFEIVYGDDIRDLSMLLKEKLDMLPLKSTVALLGRYNDNIDLKGYLDYELKWSYNYRLIKRTVQYMRRDDLEMEFFTVHRSKGLDRDYIFILNNTNRKLGFPSLTEDDDVLKLFNSDDDTYPFAEERRLFYVALTRAKKCVYLMVENDAKSSFIREIEKDYGIKEINREIVHCPECKTGELVLREGKYSEFYGCSNYPLCKYIQKII